MQLSNQSKVWVWKVRKKNQKQDGIKEQEEDGTRTMDHTETLWARPTIMGSDIKEL